jgi:hypothetical protein
MKAFFTKKIVSRLDYFIGVMIGCILGRLGITPIYLAAIIAIGIVIGVVLGYCINKILAKRPVTILLQPADHVRRVEINGEKVWQVKSKEYGWKRLHEHQVINALNYCAEKHDWRSLGDPCVLCGSDNCIGCIGCGISSHD